MFENFILKLSFSLTNRGTKAVALENRRSRIETNNDPSRSNTKRKRKIPIRITHTKDNDSDSMDKLER